MTSSIYLVTLRKDILSPFARSDEEKGTEAKAETEKPVTATPEKTPAKTSARGAAKTPAAEKTDLLKIETDGLQDRIVSVPVSAGSYRELGVAGKGEILYIAGDEGEKSVLHKYSITDRKDEEVMELDTYLVSADAKKRCFM